ncbi:hypothetical protein QN277_005467 [Acacia crassicarpa]|uniref:Uncharacterized protein n=1 Tax=Acacia crassicarpa TaxID=499986 RepID=A0AAE1JX12_9FABA|nr:hypothetical protein QN277_005467 [Acacia crassicarpa]
MKKQAMVIQAHAAAAAALVVIVMLVSPVLGCSPSGRGCKDCIVNQLKQSCPPCSPILHCMARCLWDGTSRSVCIKKCDCNNGYPTLSDCKRCMLKCKCSC